MAAKALICKAANNYPPSLWITLWETRYAHP